MGDSQTLIVSLHRPPIAGQEAPLGGIVLQLMRTNDYYASVLHNYSRRVRITERASFRGPPRGGAASQCRATPQTSQSGRAKGRPHRGAYGVLCAGWSSLARFRRPRWRIASDHPKEQCKPILPTIRLACIQLLRTPPRFRLVEEAGSLQWVPLLSLWLVGGHCYATTGSP